MGPGFKYHVVTIAAIFFALTAGLVVGSLFVSPQVADRQKDAIVRLQRRIDDDVNQNRKQISMLREYAANTRPVVVRNRLRGRTVALVQSGDYSDMLDDVREVLNQAGARFLSVTIIDRGLAHPEEAAGVLSTLHRADSRIPADRQEFLRMLARVLARGASSETLDSLRGQSLVHMDAGGDYSTGAQCVVLLGGSRRDPSQRIAQIDLPLLKALQEDAVTVVACEHLDASYSDIPFLHSGDLDIATVDHVDTDPGKLSLIYSLRGEKDDYGIKSTAHRLVPAPPAFSESR